MFISKAGVNALGRMTLLLDPGFVLFEDLIDDRDERVQLALQAVDHAQRLAKVHLRMSRGVT